MRNCTHNCPYGHPSPAGGTCAASLCVALSPGCCFIKHQSEEGKCAWEKACSHLHTAVARGPPLVGDSGDVAIARSAPVEVPIASSFPYTFVSHRSSSQPFTIFHHLFALSRLLAGGYYRLVLQGIGYQSHRSLSHTSRQEQTHHTCCFSARKLKPSLNLVSIQNPLHRSSALFTDLGSSPIPASLFRTLVLLGP